ncbi:MAG TPA: hypothetical protein VK509_14800 [Polyangiales bacterium]|nr:hypothetical protein [Polyangiales bacterium]
MRLDRTKPAAPKSRAALAAEARAGFPGRGQSHARTQARGRLARALWTARGERKLASQRELDRALRGVSAAELERICELTELGPLYLLPTRRFAHALAREIRALGVRRVHEAAAGDGSLARALAGADRSLRVTASDSGAWERAQARMSATERRVLRGHAVAGIALGSNVQREDARRAIAQHRPELILCSWLPPGQLLDELIRAPVRYVLEIGAGAGVTASAYSWRFAHEFLEGALAQSARCRLDLRPAQALHTRITLYYGAAHPEHAEDPVRRGDWLWQFRPR